MNPDEQFKAALKRPDTNVQTIELEPELRERLTKVADAMIDQLIARTDNPLHGYIVLHFMMETLKETYDIRAVNVRTEEDHGKA